MPSRGDRHGWVRAASIQITPTSPVPLAGFSSRSESFNGVHDPLEANVLCFGPEPAIALVSVDALTAGALGSELQTELSERGLMIEVIVAASHTHYAPGLDDRMGTTGGFDHEFHRLTLSRLSETILALFDEPKSSGAEPRFFMATTTGVTYAVNRRRRGFQLRRRPFRVELGSQRRPNRRGVTVDDLSSVQVYSGDDLVALVWLSHCHPTTVPWTNEVSAEYPGHVRAQLRRRVDTEQLPVIFLQGGAANVRASVSAPKNLLDLLLREIRHSLGFGGSFRVPTEEEWTHWADGLAEKVPLDAQRSGTIHPETSRSSEMLAGLKYPTGLSPSLEVVGLKLADNLVLAGVNVELMAEHVALIADLDPSATTLVFGYADRTFGYLPTTKMISEGGYEVNESLEHYGLAGEHDSDPDRALRRVSGDALKGLLS